MAVSELRNCSLTGWPTRSATPPAGSCSMPGRAWPELKVASTGDAPAWLNLRVKAPALAPGTRS